MAPRQFSGEGYEGRKTNMDESRLTPSEQVMLGIFKAQAGNRMDGELAFSVRL